MQNLVSWEVNRIFKLYHTKAELLKEEPGVQYVWETAQRDSSVTEHIELGFSSSELLRAVGNTQVLGLKDVFHRDRRMGAME